MPFHRVPKATLHEDIIDIERQGERVTFLTLDEDFAYIVTEYLGAGFMSPPRHFGVAGEQL